MSSRETKTDELRRAIQRLTLSCGLMTAGAASERQALSPSHAQALEVLLECLRRAERPSQQELGTAIGIDKSNVARLCSKMEAAGHLSQRRAPEDARVRRLALTDRGARLAERVEAASRDRFARLLRAIPSRRRSAIVAALRVLEDAIGTQTTTSGARCLSSPAPRPSSARSARATRGSR